MAHFRVKQLDPILEALGKMDASLDKLTVFTRLGRAKLLHLCDNNLMRVAKNDFLHAAINSQNDHAVLWVLTQYETGLQLSSADAKKIFSLKYRLEILDVVFSKLFTHQTVTRSRTVICQLVQAMFANKFEFLIGKHKTKLLKGLSGDGKKELSPQTLAVIRLLKGTSESKMAEVGLAQKTLAPPSNASLGAGAGRDKVLSNAGAAILFPKEVDSEMFAQTPVPSFVPRLNLAGILGKR